MARNIGRRTVVLGIVAAAGTATAVSTSSLTNSNEENRGALSEAAEPTETEVDGALRRMTLEQQIGQLFVGYAYGRDADAPHPDNRSEFGVDTPAQVVQRYQPGGLIHFSWTESLHEPRQIAELANGTQRAALRSGAGIPLLISTDQEQGDITRIGEPATQLPGSMALGAARRAADAERAATITGRELRAMGLNFNFAPSADVNVNPANPVIGVRSFSSDPHLVAELTAAQSRGFRAANVADSVKHFPGHGDTDVDSHSGLPVIEHTREQWEKLDAPPFRRAIAAGTDSVMSAHLLLPQLDDTGEPATLSPRILGGLLRDELGYRGLVVTDSLQMAGVRQRHPDAEIPVRALLAGADLMLMPNNLRVAMEGVRDAVRSGRISQQRLERSVRRVLELKQRRGLLADPFVDAERTAEIVGSTEHRRSAQEITDRTTTVVRNEDSVLPLRTPPRSVLITGSGESVITALAERVRTRGPRVRPLPVDNRDQVDAAHRAAAKHDLTIVLTDDARDDETAQQLLRALAGVGRPVIGVATSDPYDVAYTELPAWLATYSDKPVAMESLTRVLFGETGPRGTLPVAIPDPDREGVERYPFGHGLHW